MTPERAKTAAMRADLNPNEHAGNALVDENPDDMNSLILCDEPTKSRKLSS